MTLGQGRGHRASLAQFPWPMPSGKQEAAMRAWGTASLTMGTAPSPGAALAGGELTALQVVRAQASELSAFPAPVALGDGRMDSLRGPELSQQPLSLQHEERSRLRREKGKEMETEHRRRERGPCGRCGGGVAGGQKAAGLGCLPGSGQSLSCCSPRTRLHLRKTGAAGTRTGPTPSDT